MAMISWVSVSGHRRWPWISSGFWFRFMALCVFLRGGFCPSLETQKMHMAMKKCPWLLLIFEHRSENSVWSSIDLKCPCLLLRKKRMVQHLQLKIAYGPASIFELTSEEEASMAAAEMLS